MSTPGSPVRPDGEQWARAHVPDLFQAAYVAYANCTVRYTTHRGPG